MNLARSITLAAVVLPLLVWAAPAPQNAEPPGGRAPAGGAAAALGGGTKKADLGHDLELAVPAGHIFLPKADAAKLMEANGSFYNDNLLGVVSSADENSNWFVVVRYEDEGYIKDDEQIDAKELLTAIQEGTEEGNKERVERGFKPMHVKGEWGEAPHYDKARHHLIWELSAVGEEGDTSVNYNTRVLGRRGYVSMNLVVGPEGLAAGKPEVAQLLGGLQFKPGARYEDFEEGKDKAAEFGLAGLVLGGAGLGAAKLVKVGLLAKASKFILAFLLAAKKLIIVLIAGIAAFVRRLFGGKKDAETPPTNTTGE